MSAADDFEHKVRVDDHAIDLAGAAMDLAKTAYPALDEAVYLARLDALVEAVVAAAPTNAAQHLSVLTVVLFDQYGLRGNTDDYYDARNSYLNEVLERRTGIPISLSLIYLEVGWRSGLELAPVSFPGHFLVRAEQADHTPLMIDPFNCGAVITLEALAAQLKRAVGDAQMANELLPRALQPCSKREVLARLLRNLDAIYTQKKQAERALTVADLAVRLEPYNASAIRKRGALYAHVGHDHAAIADLQRYLAMDETAEDAAQIAALIARLRGSSRPLS